MPPKAAEPIFKPHPRIEHLLRKATQGNDLSRREDYTRAGLVIVEEVVDTNGNKTSRVPETATEVSEEKRPGFKWYEADSVEDAGKHVGGADYFAVISGVQKQRKKHDRAETGWAKICIRLGDGFFREVPARFVAVRVCLDALCNKE
ncbi:hypothetical protein PGQ11_009608 [Apiospora arundinis]|uniref:Uncharacterized protein n=1 Tax=Apiospora arundinis TaxID=335852 RepID=A0ABR2IIH1_9PEZI